MKQRYNKMKTNEHTKLQIVGCIRQLFALRPEAFTVTSWDCALKDGQLIVKRPFSREPTDRVIMHCFLETGQLPSLFSTYLAVRKDWQVLGEANIDVSGRFDVNGLFY